MAVLAACAGDEEFLRGERIDVRPGRLATAGTSGEAVQSAAPVAFIAPPTARNADWTHVSGGPAHRPVHPEFSSDPRPAWEVDIGQGSGRRHRITADPVVSDGRVFTLDSQARVTAVTTDGRILWDRDLTPPHERSDHASGGGLAVAADRVFVTTGFGEVVALDMATGAEIWRQDVEAPATGSPTVSGGLVYLVTRGSLAWAIDATNGRVMWRLPGTPVPSGVVGGAIGFRN